MAGADNRSLDTIFRVELLTFSQETGFRHFLNFRCGYPDVASLVADLNDGVIVVGERLRCRRIPGGRTYEIVRSETWAIARGGFAAIGLPNVTILDEPEDE